MVGQEGKRDKPPESGEQFKCQQNDERLDFRIEVGD